MRFDNLHNRSAEDLRLFQFLYLSALAIWGFQLLYLPFSMNSSFSIIHIIGRNFSVPEYFFPIATTIFIGATLMAAFGCSARFFLMVSIIAFLISGGIILGTLDLHISVLHRPLRALNLVTPTLILLAVTSAEIANRPLQKIGGLTGDAWTLPIIKFTLGLFYFGNGFFKLKLGASWLDGSTLQALLLRAWLIRGSTAPLWLAEHLVFCQALSVFTVIFEILAPVLLLFRKGERWFVFLALSFHLGVFIFLKISFFRIPFIATYFIFLRMESVRSFKMLLTRFLNRANFLRYGTNFKIH